ncbi:hypothetical protein AB833_30675 [Chromatiales bacterium (ex Bugula neritina AB1)]|nr:hypothetical protein AB833_30675 [Chromatiales bacterium (ex Bugula neritina AB1)]
MTDVVQNCIAKIKGQKKKLVLPEGDDPRIQQAALKLLELDIAEPVLLGDELSIRQSSDFNLGSIPILDPATDTTAELASALIGKKRKITADNVDSYLQNPVYRGVAMLNTGAVHAMVAGAVLPTSKVIEAAFAVGPKPGLKTLSSFFLMTLAPQIDEVARSILFADCAINIDPDIEQLAEIAITTADSASRLLSEEPRLAMLSFSTHGSARHASVSKVADAVALVRSQRPDLKIDGEMQVDTALSSRVAKSKMDNPGDVAGRANVLIFPDLDAGNIAYKLVQYCGGAQATGPVLQGFARPVCDLSRGATVDDIVSAAAVTIALSL